MPENIDIVRDLIDRFFNGHSPGLASDFFADNLTWHGGSVGTVEGVHNYADVMRGFWAALPDARARELDAIEDGDTVAMRLVVTATQTGELWGIAPTGRSVEWNAIMTYRFVDGKIVEQWAAEDWAGILQQIGYFTPPWANSQEPATS